MAHGAQLEFVSTVKANIPTLFADKTVLEIGSLDINGSIRGFFQNCKYTGLDVAAGKNVDVVCQGQKYDAPSDSFDVVVSCEVMEHNPYWSETMQNMVRLCKPGGVVILSCATYGRIEHGTARTDPESSPLTVELGWNYYKNLGEQDFLDSGSLSGLDYKAWTYYPSYDFYLIGVKGVADTEQNSAIASIERTYQMRQLASIKAIRRYLKSKIIKLS